MADTIKTIKSSGGDYSSFSAWEAGQQKSITSGDREIAECYAFEDSTASAELLAGWTVPSGAGIIIRTPTAERHTGTRGTGYRLVGSSSAWVLYIQQNYVTFDGIAIRGTSTASGSGGSTVRANNIQDFRVLNCFIEGQLADGDVLEMRVADVANRNGVVANTVVINNNASGTGFVLHCGGKFNVHNCALIHTGNAEAIRVGNLANCVVRVKNTFMHRGTGTNVYSTGYTAATFTTCRHSTSQSITGSTGSTAYSTANFTNVTAGSENPAPVSGSALIDAGTDLSADGDYAFSTDIFSATRSGTWEIGPFNYAAAAKALLLNRNQAHRIAPLLGF